MIMGTQARIKSLPFEELWQKFTGKIPKEDSEFISDGGDSFSAILFAESTKSNNSEILEILHRGRLTRQLNRRPAKM